MFRVSTLEKFYGESLAASAIEPLPPDFVSYRACRGYFSREAVISPTTVPVNDIGPLHACGVKWHHGPFRFEKYVMNDEPTIAPAPRRLVLWQRTAGQGEVAGWSRGYEGMGFRLTGFTPVMSASAGGTAAQENGWSSHGRRHAARWRSLLASGKRELVPLQMEEYLLAYRRADQDRFMKAFMPAVLRQKAKAQGDLLRFWGSRPYGGDIDAGLVMLDIPEVSTMLHVGGFVRGSAKRESAVVGLMSHSFDECRLRGLRYLDFGFFWAPGDPKDWKGFSRFKTQFGVRLVRYQAPLWKLAT